MILNHRAEPVELEVRIEAASDFADLFEVKDALKKKGSYEAIVDGECLKLKYRRQTFERETWIRASSSAAIDERGFDLRRHSQGAWSVEYRTRW